MRTSTLLFLLPALAAAAPQPQAGNSALLASLSSQALAAASAAMTQGGSIPSAVSDPCETATGAADLQCQFVAEGWNAAAAGYLATQLDRTDLSTAFDTYENLPAVKTALAAAVTANGDAAAATATDDGPRLFSILAAQITALPSGTQRNAISSIFQQGFALQSNPSAAVPTAAASGSASSSKAAAAPKQTGLGMAAGLVAGVLGLAVAL